MHFDNPVAAPPVVMDRPWYKELSRYHWFVLVVCTLGWLFDTMDQQLFNIARRPAMRALVSPDDVEEYSGLATTIFLLGWGTGGIAFGILGDLIGRAKSMVFTILLYSAFTGLSALSQEFWHFGLFRFLTGLGVGGQLAVGVSLGAEEMPDRARPFALGLLQAMSAVGNIAAGLIGISLAYLVPANYSGDAWRYMFVVGTVPALLVLIIMRRLKEPERWSKLAVGKSMRERLGAYGAELFREKRWLHHAFVGLILASSGIIGLWAIVFFSIDLQQAIFRTQLEAQGVEASKINSQVGVWAAVTSIMLNVGAFFGMYAFSRVTHRIGRKPAFAIAFVLAGASTAFVFLRLESIGDIFWMIPIMGFCMLALFGGYAIYLPELFPTRLRGSGTSFCYNGGRYVAALAPTVLVMILGYFVGKFGDTPTGRIEAFRVAGVIMCSIFVVGLAVLPFAPETKGKPLPE
jgi:MFS family permease